MLPTTARSTLRKPSWNCTFTNNIIYCLLLRTLMWPPRQRPKRLKGNWKTDNIIIQAVDKAVVEARVKNKQQQQQQQLCLTTKLHSSAQYDYRAVLYNVIKYFTREISELDVAFIIRFHPAVLPPEPVLSKPYSFSSALQLKNPAREQRDKRTDTTGASWLRQCLYHAMPRKELLVWWWCWFACSLRMKNTPSHGESGLSGGNQRKVHWSLAATVEEWVSVCVLLKQTGEVVQPVMQKLFLEWKVSFQP